MRNIITFSEWKRQCPVCGIEMYYSNKNKLCGGMKSNSVCKKCKYGKISDSLLGKKLSDDHKKSLRNGWIHRKENGYIHPMLGKIHSDETKFKMKLAKEKYNPWKGKIHSDETKLKMMESWKKHPRDMIPVLAAALEYNRGKKHSDEHKKKISDALLNRKVSDDTKNKIRQRLIGCIRSDETKEKLRNIRLQQIDEQGIKRCFNKNACKFIDDFGNKYGYKFKHALNGGESKICGYSVDGYDENKNIIFEYDEKWHETPVRKMKDLKRICNIIRKNNCKILRYSEKYNRYYWSFPDKSDIFIKI